MPADFVKVEGSTIKLETSLSTVFAANREIKIEDFYICDHELTQKEYVAIMNDNPSLYLNNPAPGELQENRAMDSISWQAALVYCNKRSIKEGLSPCYSIDGKTDPDSWGLNIRWEDSAWDNNSKQAELSYRSRAKPFRYGQSTGLRLVRSK